MAARYRRHNGRCEAPE
ncbi:unnamed protein product [Leptidea sinapis]|uniref:Uncharacterized protein n=1 Tax=Leptidea sinapis TaxID=189913 RepID=A0A5E4Q9G4_9NEOP|nr:unnamed protein product [Leptidea sinapis]